MQLYCPLICLSPGSLRNKYERREKTYGYMPIKSYTTSRANYIGIGLKKA
jgi:hypothetical protein